MSHILFAWRFACIVLRPRYLGSLLKKSVLTFAQTFIVFMRNFGWLLGIDAFFALAFGDIMSKATLHVTSGKSIDGSFFILTFFQNILWLVISSAFLLLLRKNDQLAPKAYFKVYFFRYIKLTLLLSLMSLMFLYLLLACGITHLPHAPWTLMLCIRIVEYCIIFYWLDSKTHFADLFYSIDKAVNLAFYNAPFFIVLFTLFWCSDYGLRIVAGNILGSKIGHILFINNSNALVSNYQKVGIIIKALCLHYAFFIYECFLLSVLFCFYRRNKHEQYTKALFEKS